MPETSASGVAEELLPPDFVWLGAGPLFQRSEIAPIVPHAHVAQRIEETLVQQQPVGTLIHRVRDLRSEAKEGADAGQRVHAHSQVDHDQIRISGEVGRLAARRAHPGIIATQLRWE